MLATLASRPARESRPLFRNLSPGAGLGWLCALITAAVVASVTASLPARAHVGVSEQIEELDARIEAEPDVPGLLLQRGELHRINRHSEAALADFRKVQQLEPGNVDAELGLGRTWLDQGLYEKSIRHFNRVLERQPANVRGLVARASALSQLGKPLAAADDYARAIKTFHEPASPGPELYFERARALQAAGPAYFGAALQTLDEGINRLGAIRVLEDLAIDLERKRGHYAAALERLERIITRSTRQETLLLTRGDILLAAGREDAARAAFIAAREALDRLPLQRQHSQAMQTLRGDIENRIQILETRGGSAVK